MRAGTASPVLGHLFAWLWTMFAVLLSEEMWRRN